MKHTDIPEDSKSRRASANPPLLSDHTGLVHDHSFSPFLPTYYNDSHLFSTCSADCTIKIWKIRQKDQTIHGHVENPQSDVFTLRGHEKKVNTGDFHPSVNHLYVSSSTDNTLRIWDLQMQKDQIVLRDDFDDLVQSWDWSQTASVLYTSCRDTVARVYDPRTKYAIVVRCICNLVLILLEYFCNVILFEIILIPHSLVKHMTERRVSELSAPTPINSSPLALISPVQENTPCGISARACVRGLWFVSPYPIRPPPNSSPSTTHPHTCFIWAERATLKCVSMKSMPIRNRTCIS